MTFDTIDSVNPNSASGNLLDTVLAVYTGADLAHLTQVAANDEMFPTLRSFLETFQPNYVGPSSFKGPSALRFNAVAGAVYYIAVDTPSGTGLIALNWA